MDMAGVYVIDLLQHWQAAQQPVAWCAAFPVRRVNARNPQDMHCQPRQRFPSSRAQLPLCIDPPQTPGRAGINQPGFVN